MAALVWEEMSSCRPTISDASWRQVILIRWHCEEAVLTFLSWT